ncbi:MAG: thiamine-phosphate synthase family protein [bacterium]
MSIDKDIENKLLSALKKLEDCREFVGLIPEVRTNLVYSREDPKTPQDVMAIDGRITVVDGMPKAAGKPKYGVSSHMARLIIEFNKRDASICSGIDFANTPQFSDWLQKYCETKGWVFAPINRDNEPEDAKVKDEGSIPWKVREALRVSGGKIPKICYESAAIGKEPLSFLVGKDPVEVVDQIIEISKEVNKEIWGKMIRI